MANDEPDPRSPTPDPGRRFAAAFDMSVHANIGGAAAAPRANIAARLGGIILVVLGLLFVASSLLGFLPEDRRMTVTGLLLFGVLGLVLGCAGIVWLRRQKVDETGALETQQERAVLELIARNNGQVSLAEVARGLGLAPPQAEAVLGRLTAQRMVEPDLTTEGAVVYRAKELL